MTSDEQELVKVGAEAALRPFSNLMEKLFGGSVEQVGGMWEDSLKLRRHMRRVKLLAKVQAKLDEAGFEPHQIPDKVWQPIFESASTEDDDFLQDQWANLLTNAANPHDDNEHLASFVKILQQLTSKDAKLLKVIYEESRGTMLAPNLFQYYVMIGLARVKDTHREIDDANMSEEDKRFKENRQLDERDFGVTLDRLLGLRLLDKETREQNLNDEAYPQLYGRDRPVKFADYNVTTLGEAFVQACNKPPKPKAKA